MYVQFVVGRNGTGKSQYLINTARALNRRATYICNTVHDRSAVLRNISRFSAKNSSSRPNNIIKKIIVRLLKEGPHRLHQIERVLIHCGYQTRITLRIEKGRDLYPSITPSDRDLDFVTHVFNHSNHGEYEIRFGEERNYLDLSSVAALLEDEARLRSRGLIGLIKINLYKNNGEQIPLLKASSGELSLIASMMFILSEIDNTEFLFIDEPENSLHPQWQREYVSMLYDLLGYHRVKVFVATHSPLVVTGALLDSRVRSEIYHPETGKAELSASTNIEGLLWEQFETIPPASRFLSEKLVEKLDDLSLGNSSLDQTLEFIRKANDASFDYRQKQLFVAASELATKINQENKDAQ